MDTKEIIRQTLRKNSAMFTDEYIGVVTAELSAALESAAKPVEKVKTAGELAAEKFFCLSIESGRLMMFYEPELISTQFTVPGLSTWEIKPLLEQPVRLLAKAFDAQRADAAKVERELHASFRSSFSTNSTIVHS